MDIVFLFAITIPFCAWGLWVSQRGQRAVAPPPNTLVRHNICIVPDNAPTPLIGAETVEPLSPAYRLTT